MGKLNALLERLDKVRQIGDRYIACCPAHDDKTPSLTIRETPTGTILAHCFGGCDIGSVLAAVGLTFSDLYPDEWDSAKHAGLSEAGRQAKAKWFGRIDPLELERTILEIAKEDIESGRELSNEDYARAELAFRRLANGSENATQEN